MTAPETSLRPVEKGNPVVETLEHLLEFDKMPPDETIAELKSFLNAQKYNAGEGIEWTNDLNGALGSYLLENSNKLSDPELKDFANQLTKNMIGGGANVTIDPDTGEALEGSTRGFNPPPPPVPDCSPKEDMKSKGCHEL